ncbi:MAG: secondary thiamine-phosphate synthase enzyme YjbQ [bacterium]|nr:secondary thiamine-phosphate synthase enzyme YjbQ [bacterium]
MIRNINISSSKRSELIDITARIEELVEASNISDGVCHLYVPHTTAALTINEGADPSVKRDIIASLDKLAPYKGDYMHMEGNSDAHIKATLTGSSESILIEKGSLLLGTWQSVYFCEFDGLRSRQLMVKIVEG